MYHAVFGTEGWGFESLRACLIIPYICNVSCVPRPLREGLFSCRDTTLGHLIASALSRDTKGKPRAGDSLTLRVVRALV